jgi:beta-mannosidase
LRRKPSWYFVRRAYAPLRLIMRYTDDGRIRVVAANDTRDEILLELEYGYVRLDGRGSSLERCMGKAGPTERTELAVFEPGDYDPNQGLWITRVLGDSEVVPAILRAVDFARLQTVEPGLSWSLVPEADDEYTVQVHAEAYAHAVHLLLPEGAVAADNYFDLLPGETREVRVVSSEPLGPGVLDVACVQVLP